MYDGDEHRYSTFVDSRFVGCLNGPRTSRGMKPLWVYMSLIEMRLGSEFFSQCVCVVMPQPREAAFPPSRAAAQG